MNEMLMSMPTTGTLIHAELAVRQLLSYVLFVLMLPVFVAAQTPVAKRAVLTTMGFASPTAVPVGAAGAATNAGVGGIAEAR